MFAYSRTRKIFSYVFKQNFMVFTLFACSFITYFKLTFEHSQNLKVCFFHFYVQKLSFWSGWETQSSVQFSLAAHSYPTLCDSKDSSTPGFPDHHQLPELAQTHVHWVSDAIQPSYPLLSPSPPDFSLSQHQGLFQCVSSRFRWPKYWSFSFSISASNEYSGLISLRIDWFDLLAVQGTSPGPLNHSSKASILQHSAFFIVQFSHTWLLEKS